MLNVIAVCLTALSFQLVVADDSDRCYMKDLNYPGLLKPQKDFMKYGEHFEVSCDKDYDVSPGIFLCLKGNWDNNIVGGSPCRKMECHGEPPSTENGSPMITSRVHGHIIWYKCDNGYERIKGGRVICEYGRWEGKTPICADYRCYLKDLNYTGLLKPQKIFIKHGEQFEVSCDKDFDASPGMFLCERGNWENNIVEGNPCKKKFCEDEPPLLENGKPKEYNRETGSTVDYECEEGYELLGNSTVYCAFGAWDGKPPICKWDELRFRNHCMEEPPLLKNGKPKEYNRETGSTVDYECEEGYELEGNSTVYCAFGAWDGKPPVCKWDELRFKNHCMDEPPLLKNGKPKEYNREPGSTVDYECEKSYELVGTSTVYCALGVWDGKPPVCSYRCSYCSSNVCGMPKGPEHGFVELSENPPMLGATAKYFCDKGKTLVGNTASTCLKLTEWRPPGWFFSPPTCFNSCLVPDIQNGKLQQKPITDESLFLQEGEFVDHLKTVTLLCTKLTNGRSRDVKCNNGIWSEPLDCHPKNCIKPPPKFDHAQAIIHSRTHGSTISYSCTEKPYTVSEYFSNYKVMCLFGEWTVTSGQYITPKCSHSGACEVPYVYRAKIFYEIFEGQGEEYWNWKQFRFVRDDLKIEMSEGYFMFDNTKGQVVCEDGRVINMECKSGRVKPYPNCYY